MAEVSYIPMESPLVIFALALVPVWVALIIAYVRALTFVANYSQSHHSAVFDRNYANIYHLISDIGFLNDLWAGNTIDATQDTELRQVLLRAHKLLRINMGISIAMFLAVIINVFLHA